MGRLVFVLAALFLSAPATAAAQNLHVLALNVQGGTAADGREPDIPLLLATLIEAAPPTRSGSGAPVCGRLTALSLP